MNTNVLILVLWILGLVSCLASWRANWIDQKIAIVFLYVILGLMLFWK